MTTKNFLSKQLDEAQRAIQENRWDDAIDSMDEVYAMVRKIQDKEARDASRKKKRRY